MGRGTSANNSDESALKVNNSTVYTVTQTENNTSNVKAYANTVTFTDTFATADKLQISSSSDGTDTTSYTYYADGQLHTVSGTNYSASYTYNSRGNLTERTVNNVTTDYTYSGDRLTAVGNTALTYDSIGNVLTFGNKQYTWSSGRNLASITDGTNNYSYSYNKYGFRTSKTVGGTTTYFNVAEDGTIVSQTDGTDTIFFEYSEVGTPLGFVLNNTQYIYITNNSGDVMAIADSSGNIIAAYSYNEWGVPTVSAAGEQNIVLANLNPIRYRGYYYDSETGYYYLQSRYYDPEICRFINADLPDYAKEQKNETAGINLFVYCCNDAVNGSDPSGNKKSHRVYIIYDNSYFKTQAMHEKKKWKAKAKSYTVTMFSPPSKKSFVSYWNKNVSSASTVVIISHGSPRYIGLGDGFRNTNVCELNNKSINSLYIYACNCGHKDVKNNIAVVLKNRLTKTKKIYAMDGSISYYPPFHHFEYKYYKPRLSFDQRAFYDDAKPYRVKDINGFWHYYYRIPYGLYRVK